MIGEVPVSKSVFMCIKLVLAFSTVQEKIAGNVPSYYCSRGLHFLRGTAIFHASYMRCPNKAGGAQFRGTAVSDATPVKTGQV